MPTKHVHEELKQSVIMKREGREKVINEQAVR